MPGVFRWGLQLWRSIAGPETAVEQFLRHQYHAARRRVARRYDGEHCVVFWAGSRRKQHTGIYMKGSCDLISIFSCQPLIQEVLDGTCCIMREGTVSGARSDRVLQTLQYFPEEYLEPVIQKFKLPAGYFKPQLFGKTFVVPGMCEPVEFPKNVVILSIAADVTRVLYRHREHGVLVDPGEWWNTHGVGAALADLATAQWFRESFVAVGRISVDEFRENFTRIIETLRSDTGAHVLVFNVLTVEVGARTHNYQFVKASDSMRRREFNLALVELSRRLDFPIVDVDRILKRSGIGGQVDFGHFPPARYQAVAQEAFRIMRDLGVF